MKNKFRRANKLNRYEKKELQRQRIENATHGTGKYLFINPSKISDVMLVKPIMINGKEVRSIGPGKTFEADSYYVSMVQQGQLRIVKVIEDPNKEKTMTEEKLILDQPERFTHQGKTEQVVPSKKESLNENQPAKAKPVDTLITEDPMSGVEILLS